VQDVLLEKTLLKVWHRDGGRCVICGRKYPLDSFPHHAFFRSEYFGKDRDEAWNLCLICIKCHREIHTGNKKKNRFCKELALKRYNGPNKKILENIFKRNFMENKE